MVVMIVAERMKIFGVRAVLRPSFYACITLSYNRNSKRLFTVYSFERRRRRACPYCVLKRRIAQWPR